MKVVNSIMTKNPCYTAGRKITVKGLMLHSVGCPQPSASVFIRQFNKSTYRSACVHAFIDANDGTVYQTLPWNHRAWHGGSSSNSTHIGVEMCEPGCIKYTSGAKFTCSNIPKAKEMVKRTYDAAVELFAYLCKEYNLNPLADGVIVSHKEGAKRGIASNHGDPEHLWTGLQMGYTMDSFRQAVKSAMGGGSTVDKATASTTKTESTTTTSKGESTVNVELNVLQKGSNGEQVKALQRMLHAMGYSLGTKNPYDGDFGSKTDTAVRAYQKAHNLYVDGIVGAKTWNKLLKG